MTTTRTTTPTTADSHAELWVMQGLAGAAGLGVLVWLVFATDAGRRRRLLGRAPVIVAAGCGGIALALWVLGYGAATSLIQFIPLGLCGILLAIAGRRG